MTQDHKNDKVNILQNDFTQIQAMALDYANENQYYASAEEAEEKIRNVHDFTALLQYFWEGDGILYSTFAEILFHAKIIDFDPHQVLHNTWWEVGNDELAVELDLLFTGITRGLDDGDIDVLRI